MSLPPKPWPTGTVEQIEPMVARVLAPNGSPFTFTGTQTYLVGTTEGLAVIDPGPDDPDHLAALTTAIGTAPLVIESDAPRVDAPFDKAYAPDRVLADGESLTGPGWTLTALATPGHTSNHLCYALEETGALFTGDHVMAWSTSVVVPPDGDMADYMASLALLQDRDDRVYYPAHGPAIDKPRQLVRGMIGHRMLRERQIVKLLAEEPRAIAALVPVMYKGVSQFLWPAAAQSVHAHLIELERRGQVVERGDIWHHRTDAI
jgi:glyoxylase-like metal-dependent hydrolase (beta-lactamase superfamily II)